MPGFDDVQILVTHELGTAGPTLTNRADECVDELNALKARLAPLADSWTRSQAASFYQEKQAEWDTAALGLFGPEGILAQIAHAMNVNYGNYADAELSNISTWRSGN
ncbi:WXG100 family type VII secretion target [Streptomyces liangshanensis]|uniref:WXG100 family type VII secretion target n=1 Tax=Streptomyces liangshanensis TaxID=2717324 RepID=A0A6G9GZN9_9ACTN|nr:WXG100 family type VII secretion target [Streptomyces liangshanensis]QIQ03509.1 WXG100 family type VII secretion target [Streptomyces liangshanensis]